MKDPKALFPVLFASSWLGNLLLTVLAFYLAFTSEGPLTPLLFASVALCILSGNILPILVYMITLKIRRLELEAESTEVTWRVQEGLKRSEDVMNRLDEAEGALAKSVLVARQVPERIRETLDNVHSLADKINTLEVESFTESISKQTAILDSFKSSLENLAKSVSTAEADLGVIGKDVKSLTKSQMQIVENFTDSTKGRKPKEFEVSVAERLDLVFETLENVQDSLDGLLQRIASLSQVTAGEGSTAPGKATREEPEKGTEDASPEEIDPDDMPDDDRLEDDDAEDEEQEPDDESNSDDPDEDSDETFELTDGRTRLIAHAMIGMHNKLYVRGDPPWLSWEDGQQMELIGIGEFSWSIDDLKEEIEVTVLLNDEYAAEQGTVVLNPGKTVRINPTFPRF